MNMPRNSDADADADANADAGVGQIAIAAANNISHPSADTNQVQIDKIKRPTEENAAEDPDLKSSTLSSRDAGVAVTVRMRDRQRPA
ncbi:MAG: hypothetical protein ACOC0P_05390 [Planctomycetota bacterium]